MPETRTDVPSLSWSNSVTASVTEGYSSLERVIAEEILPRVSTINRPTKLKDASGMFWTPLKGHGIQGAKVGDDCRVYTRNGRVVGGRHGLGTSLTSDLAERILLTKSSVKQHLAIAGLPVPEGRLFSFDDEASARAYIESNPGPVVVKPNGRTSGEGVSTGVLGRKRFRAAWRWAAAASTQAERPRPWDLGETAEANFERILVEPDDAGLALRVFVTGEKVVGAVIRLPMFVVGDGTRSIGELFAELSGWRAQHAFLRRMTPRERSLERSLEHLGLTTDVIPGPGEVCRLQEGPNEHRGGLSLDVTDRLHPDVESLAIDARWAIPGLLAAGVDLSVPQISSSRGVVIGVDDRASQQIHLYPAFGASRHVTQGIVDLFVQRA